MEINDPGAYRYPPTFALLTVPLAPLPEELVTWAYRGLCVGCVRYLVGSWRAVGWALLFVPLQIELIALNVTLPIAAVARQALRGTASAAGAALIPATAALKYADGPGHPRPRRLACVRRDGHRRPHAVGGTHRAARRRSAPVPRAAPRTGQPRSSCR